MHHPFLALIRTALDAYEVRYLVDPEDPSRLGLPTLDDGTQEPVLVHLDVFEQTRDVQLWCHLGATPAHAKGRSLTVVNAANVRRRLLKLTHQSDGAIVLEFDVEFAFTPDAGVKDLLGLSLVNFLSGLREYRPRIRAALRSRESLTKLEREVADILNAQAPEDQA